MKNKIKLMNDNEIKILEVFYRCDASQYVNKLNIKYELDELYFWYILNILKGRKIENVPFEGLSKDLWDKIEKIVNEDNSIDEKIYYNLHKATHLILLKYFGPNKNIN